MVRKNKKAPWEEEEEIIWVSKTEMKEDMLALQKLGEALVNLKPDQLKKFPLEEQLYDAILQAQRFKHESRRRQLQYIGKLMRHVDPDPIEQQLDLIRNKHARLTAQFHRLEQLRDEMLEEGDEAIDQLMTSHPHADRQRLRQLVRQAQKEKKNNRPPKAAKEIFQLLKSYYLDAD